GEGPHRARSGGGTHDPVLLASPRHRRTGLHARHHPFSRSHLRRRQPRRNPACTSRQDAGDDLSRDDRQRHRHQRARQARRSGAGVTEPQRQFIVLVRNQLRLDFRSRGSQGALRHGATLGIALFVFGMLGFTFWSIADRAHLPLEGAAALVYVLGGLVVLMQTVQMHGDLLFSPQDGDVLNWRPIESRTLFAARVAHALFYISFIVTPAALFCAVAYGRKAPHSFAVFASFIGGAWLASLFFTSCALLLQGFLLRHAPGERFQQVLSVAQMLTLAGTVAAY